MSGFKYKIALKYMRLYTISKMAVLRHSERGSHTADYSVLHTAVSGVGGRCMLRMFLESHLACS